MLGRFGSVLSGCSRFTDTIKQWVATILHLVVLHITHHTSTETTLFVRDEHGVHSTGSALATRSFAAGYCA